MSENRQFEYQVGDHGILLDQAFLDKAFCHRVSEMAYKSYFTITVKIHCLYKSTKNKNNAKKSKADFTVREIYFFLAVFQIVTIRQKTFNLKQKGMQLVTEIFLTS